MPAKLDRCVRRVRRKNKKANPYAVCNAALKRRKRKRKKK